MIAVYNPNNKDNHNLLNYIAEATKDIDKNYAIVTDFKSLYKDEKHEKTITLSSSKKRIVLIEKANENQRLFNHLKNKVPLFFKQNEEVSFKNFPCVYVLESNNKALEFLEKMKKEEEKTEKKEELNINAVTPKFSLNKVVLNKNIKDDIITALSIIKHRNKIYNDWGFSEIDQKPKLILNFFGASGTGKTMSAHGVAYELNKKILLINYSEIESKYVGDAPKNLMKAFEIATKTNALLFFDEADSFLGKRIENVSSSSDQSVNSLRSQMLILLEEFEGVVIFATNLIKNYDKAFESRILKHIHFELPNKENRIKIISQMLPKKAPIKFEKENFIEELSEISEGFSGRELKNAVLETFTLAVTNSNYITENHFKTAFNNCVQRKKAIIQKPILTKEQKSSIEQKIKKELKK